MSSGHVDRGSPPAMLPVGTAVVVLVDRARGGAVPGSGTSAETGRAAGSDAARGVARGATGIIARQPVDADHAYRVRLADGREVSLLRNEMQVLKHFQLEGGPVKSGGRTADAITGAAMNAGPAIRDPLDEHGLRGQIIFSCVVGSRAYGLERDASDVDRRGVYLAPACVHWSLAGAPEQLETPGTESCYWELEKFIRLALKANPNVLEALYTPIVEHATSLALDLLAMRGAFMSRLIYQTFNGYAMSQFVKLEQDLRRDGRIKWKHAMHLVRLLQSGITALRTGEVAVRVEKDRERLLAIRDGLTPWEKVDAWRLELNAEFERAYAETGLPERPDYARADAFLLRARREAARADLAGADDRDASGDTSGRDGMSGGGAS